MFLWHLKPSFSDFFTYDVETLVHFQDIEYFCCGYWMRGMFFQTICSNPIGNFDGIFLFDKVHHYLAYKFKSMPMGYFSAFTDHMPVHLLHDHQDLSIIKFVYKIFDFMFPSCFFTSTHLISNYC